MLAERIADEAVHEERVARVVPLLAGGMILSAGRSGDVVVTKLM
jgi:hypothetical protein